MRAVPFPVSIPHRGIRPLARNREPDGRLVSDPRDVGSRSGRGAVCYRACNRYWNMEPSPTGPGDGARIRYRARRGRDGTTARRADDRVASAPACARSRTLADVAISSVSRVLSEHPDVSAEMRERVMAAVAELEYEPDFLAQSLRRGATLSVGYVVGDISNPLIATITSGRRIGARARPATRCCS